ncbi:hypothetical protein RBB84_23405 [Rhodococcus sp. D-6]|uniref:Uncharacterized protein n=1 Tax=Rhodococcus sp. D-6 TaxID=1387842 RepID=A0AAU7UXH0_9NOCA|nr:hypothetical protein [Rhodococcus sp. HS-D2]
MDDSAPEMAAFIATLDGVPFRVDYDKLDLAARAIVRMPMSTRCGSRATSYATA